ncbi:MAG: SRPBCC family protein [Candidatus Hodarchaeales archaeon]|jgi:uncharacterized protein YndB with AHSA1/START domain
MTIEIEITINKSKDEIFSYWIDHSKLELWLTQKSGETYVKPTKNGKYCLDINKSHITKGSKIISINFNQEMEFSWIGPNQFDDFLNFPGELTTVKTFLYAIDNTRTTLKLQHFGWKSSEDYQEARDWHEKFWNNRLIDLKKKIESYDD